MIRRGTLIAYGEVRYCVPVGTMFHVGIRVQEVIEWSDSKNRSKSDNVGRGVNHIQERV